MQVLLHTDKNIDGGVRTAEYLETLAQGELHRFGEHITRVEAHLADALAPRNANGAVTLSLSAEIRERVFGPGEIFFGDNKAVETGTLVLSVTAVSDGPGLSAPSLILGKEDLGNASSGAGSPGTTGGFATGASAPALPWRRVAPLHDVLRAARIRQASPNARKMAR